VDLCACFVADFYSTGDDQSEIEYGHRGVMRHLETALAAGTAGPSSLNLSLTMATPHVTTWSQAPELAIPDRPAILGDSHSLWLAYATTAEPTGDWYAVVRFNDVIDHRLSPINDEGIGKHQYASAGLQWYTFNEVIDSKEAIEWRILNARHWVITFKDNTLDVLAESADVIVEAVNATNPVSVLLSVIGSDESDHRSV
jgi:hypothetical protein